MTTKMMVLTQIMAPYRIPMFNLIADDPRVELEVLFAAEREPHRAWSTHEDEIRFNYEVLPEYFAFRQTTSWTHLSRGLLGRLRRSKPDVVVAGGWDQLTHLWAYVLRHVFGYRFVWWVESTANDARPGSVWRERLKSWVVPRADSVVVPGSASRDYAVALGAKDVVVAPNSVDNERFRRSEPPADGREFRFIYVGRLHEEKGIQDLLAAWRQLPDPDLRLTIVGDGPMKEVVREAAGRDPRIALVGHVQRDELGPLLWSANALVLPSRTEPWGLVINEAMAAELPVITTSASGGARDLIREGSNGYVVPPRDSAVLATTMKKLADAPEQARSMGLRSAEMIEAYSPAAGARGFVGLALGTR